MKAHMISLAAGLLALCQGVSAQWEETGAPNNVPVWCLAGQGTILFAGSGPYGPFAGGIFLSTDSGSTWTPANSGLTSLTVRALAVSGPDIFAGTYGGVFRSASNGASWIPANIGLTNNRVHALAVCPDLPESGKTSIFAGTYGGVFLSTNNGTSWSRVSTGLTNPDVMALAVGPPVSGSTSPTIYAGTYGGGVFFSSNCGSNWSAANTGLTNAYVYALAVSDSTLYAGTYGGGVIRSLNGGTTWTQINSGLTNTSVQSLLALGSSLFVATGAGVFYSANEGDDWEPADSSLMTKSVLSVALHQSAIYAGTRAAGIWRCPFTEMKTVHVEQRTAEAPAQIVLLQNWPNPFNPTTTIRFTVAGVVAPSGASLSGGSPERSRGVEGPASSRVRLVVYDILGREVAVLVDEQKQPGEYTATWDARGMASGVYIYRLTAGKFSEVKRMTLIR